jgi:hypothetical protein
MTQWLAIVKLLQFSLEGGKPMFGIHIIYQFKLLIETGFWGFGVLGFWGFGVL